VAIGYACLTIGVPGTELSRCTLKNASEVRLRELIIHNLTALEAMIDYNIKNNLMFFRISSDIIPFGSHPVNQLAWWKDYEDILYSIGRKIRESQMRVSMHPGQYTVLNSFDENVIENAVKDLLYHDRLLDSLGMDSKSKLVLHIGGVYGDKKKAGKEFVNNFKKLPNSIKNRLILENDDKNYTTQEVLEIAEQTKSPVVFDNLHNTLNPSLKSLDEMEWMIECGKTWRTEDGKQKIHCSQQGKGATPGSHSNTIWMNPFLEFYANVPAEADIMLEVKDKNLSAVKCRNTACYNANGMELEKEWAKYKYYVLSRSAALYSEIRQLLKDKKSPLAKEFYEKVETAMILSEDKGAEVNAAEHVWGYISKDSSTAEKNRFQKLISGYKNGDNSIVPVKKHLLKCAAIRKIDYLIESYYFYL